MVRLTIVDMNPVEQKFYPFMTSLNKCTGSCNVFSPKICVPKETKDIYVKTFNIITKKGEGKAITEHISCDCKCKFNSTIWNSKQKWNNKTSQYECKSANKIIVGILAHLFVTIVSIKKVLLILQWLSVMKL